MDIMVRGILKVGDIPDIAAAIAPRPLVLAGFVNGRNVPLTSAALEQVLSPVRQAYEDSNQLTIRAEPVESDLTAWLIARLK